MANRRSRNRAANGRATTLRLIGGDWGGRRLPIVEANGLRPTGERVRETLFNWLAPIITGARCIDCFAGTGALGLEALSRGATHVDFIEPDRRVADTLHQSIDLLEADNRAQVLKTEFQQFKPNGHPIDIAFIDPPFDRAGHTAAVEQITPALATEARVYLEYPADQSAALTAAIEPWLETLRTKRAGAVGFCLARPHRQSPKSDATAIL